MLEANSVFEFIFPFAQYDFLKKALVASWVLCLGSVPLGIFVVLKRMTLIGDALSHSLLPGVALGYFIFGFSMPAMTVGGFFAGVVVLILSTLVTSLTRTKQESSFASFYLISLSFGVLVISSRGTATDLHHVLFGNLLAIDNSLLVLIGTISSLTLLFISVFYRALVLESFDANAFKSYVTQQKFSIVIPWAFLGFLVSNLVSSFHAIGTLLSLGLIVLPAATAFLWARQVQIAMILGLAVSLTACYLGLLISFHFNLASGPAIVLVLGSAYVMSIVYQLFTK